MDDYLIEFCAPTLASIKVGSLFNYAFNTEAELYEHVERLNDELKEKGLTIILLRVRNGRALTYVYRKSQLKTLLERPEIQEFLMEYGYMDLSEDAAVARLGQRVRFSEEFPHEIGVFLGYPLVDVQGFICYHGRNCTVQGLWKAYGDENAAQKRFSQLKKCQRIYRRLWSQGRSLEQLTVAV